MPCEYPERHVTRAGREALANRLGLTIDPFSQDWECEVAGPARFEEWLTVYQDARLSDDERLSLMEMLVEARGRRSRVPIQGVRPDAAGMGGGRRGACRTRTASGCRRARRVKLAGRVARTAAWARSNGLFPRRFPLLRMRSPLWTRRHGQPCNSAPDGGDTAAPTTILIDGSGTVRWTFRPDRVLTRLSPAQLLAAIDKEVPADRSPRTAAFRRSAVRRLIGRGGR